MEQTDKGEIIIYQSPDGVTKLEVHLKNDTVWLTQSQLCELFGKSKSTVSEHISHIFEEGELERAAVVRNFRTTAADGKSYDVVYYNLDVIISVGYRVKSLQGTHFRRWATERLKEYLIKGFTMDDERLKQLGGGVYWKELLQRIRDIRSSEKVMYRQILDLYATAIDYDPHSKISIEFFKIVQNKFHFAAHGHTAAEIIYERADSQKPFMGMSAFQGTHPTLQDARIAKNYLNEDELKVLNSLVSGYFDFAEVQAMKRRPMHMADYIRQLDALLSATGEEVLKSAGNVSHLQAMKKAEEEFRKYENRTLSPVEIAYYKTILQLNEKLVEKKDE